MASVCRSIMMAMSKRVTSRSALAGGTRICGGMWLVRSSASCSARAGGGPQQLCPWAVVADIISSLSKQERDTLRVYLERLRDGAYAVASRPIFH